MTQVNGLIEQVLDCCLSHNTTLLNKVFAILNESVLAQSLQRLQNNTDSFQWFCKYLKDKLQSVVGILKATKLLRKGHYPPKRKRVGSQEARDRGTRLHKWIENYLKGRELEPCPSDLEPWIMSIKPVLEQIKQVIHLEESVFHLELGYWGKVDCIVQFLNEDLCLLEWKTTNHPYQEKEIHEAKIQCAAYIEAVNKTYGLSLEQAQIVVALPNQEAQVFVLKREELNQHFQEWQKRVKKATNDVLATITYPKSGFELLIDFLDVATEVEEDDGKPGKVARGRRRAQTKKKHYTEDSILLYLQEIGRIRLLRADEEIELARKIADLLQLERVREQLLENLEREPQDKEWAEAVNMPLGAFRNRLYLGRRAKDKMVQSNLRLVVSIAKKYMNRGLSFQDLIQEGSLGLIRAAEKFDHEKGYKFSTYATWWIRQAITRAIADQSRTIRLPVHLYETISRIKKTTKLLSQEMGRKPTEEEIAIRMEMTIEKLRFIAKSAQLPISLETPIYAEKDFWFDGEDQQKDLCLGDMIEADNETPEEQVSKNLLREDIESVLDTLSPRERDVLRLRYGLDDGRMKTLEEIGQIFNVNRERIRQIEAKALRKLRHPNRNSILKEYLHTQPSYNWQLKKDERQFESKQSNTQSIENKPRGVSKHSLDLAEENHKYSEAVKNNNIYFLSHITYFNQGVHHYSVGNFHGAVEEFNRAIELNPYYADAYNKRSSAYAALQNYQKAIDDLRIATNLYLT